MKLLLVTLALVISTLSYSQDDSIQNIVNLKPVRDQWLGTTVIDNQTTLTPLVKNFEFIIHHRFSSIENGMKDLFGIYGASNIRLGVNYGLTNRLMIGFGSEKDKKMQEFVGKFSVFQQNRGGSIPFSLALYANTSICTQDKKYWGIDYSFKDRLSYFSQLIISRKFGNRISILASGSYSHINKIPSLRIETVTDSTQTVQYFSQYCNDAIGISAAAHLAIFNTIGFICEYSQGFYIGENRRKTIYTKDPKPNVALGFEMGTPTHVFQLFASSYRYIVPQNNYILNQFDVTKKSGIMFGFNIIVKY